MLLLEEENKDIQQVSHKFNITEIVVIQSFNMKESKRDWLFRVQVIYKTMTYLQIYLQKCFLLFLRKKQKLCAFIYIYNNLYLFYTQRYLIWTRMKLSMWLGIYLSWGPGIIIRQSWCLRSIIVEESLL